ncbi:uncharacterized protein LOC126812476 [Patella vulgata]|uniref:uncharacterized protein LOC126812476 n=1 Tax=Patella vulgata TaxID=6465 RepID=UPI00217F2584|nr:uncharacterized protein LOC126812476 [Patella vulgata]
MAEQRPVSTEKNEKISINNDTINQNQNDKEENEGKDEMERASVEEIKQSHHMKPELTNMKSLYQHRSQPCLPHVLSDYGMETSRQKKKKLSDKARREKRRKRRQEFVDSDDERDKEREKFKEEKYLSVVDDLHKLRNYYYREYRDLLTNKIERQRQEIKERSEVMLSRSHLKEEDEKAASHKVKRRLPKHVMVHNDQYLKNIPKTDMSKIVNLQTKLQKQGKLKTQSDIDQFWTSIQNPDVFALYFNSGNGSTISPDPCQLSEFVAPRPLSQINESAESSRPTTRGDNWAVTQQYKHQHKSPGLSRQKTNTSVGKQAAMNLEKKCPMVEMPPLHCFTMDLSAKPPDPEVTSKRVQLKAVEKQRKKFMGKLHKMHQLAMANHALAARILDKHEDLTMFLQGPDLSDLISDYYYNKSPRRIPSPPLSSDQWAVEMSHQLPVLPDIPSRGSSETSQLSTSPIEEEDESPKAFCDTPMENKMKMIMEKPSAPLPLTMTEVMAQCRVVEPKVLSTNWNNYLRAGKTN